MDRDSATQKVGRLFAGNMGRWFSIPEIIAAGGGLGGWRTEVSRLHTDYGMSFECRVTRDARGKVVTSERRCVSIGWWPNKRPSVREAA